MTSSRNSLLRVRKPVLSSRSRWSYPVLALITSRLYCLPSLALDHHARSRALAAPSPSISTKHACLSPQADWDQSETYGAAIEKEAAAAGSGKKGAGGLDSLWEDNWDDDDIEDDFSVQLRFVSLHLVARSIQEHLPSTYRQPVKHTDCARTIAQR